MDTLEKLIEEFKKFPGIGPRQARRFAYHILNLDQDSAAHLGALVGRLKSGISTCSRCFRFFSPKFAIENEAKTPPLCGICLDQNRDQRTLMIVTHDTDINAVEQRRIYNGLYFVMGKSAELSSLDPLTLPRLRDLEDRIKKDAGREQQTKEIILAMNANTEGEHTAEIIERRLREVSATLPPEARFRVTALGRGLSTGTELEYSDAETLKSAIENRR
jgi:recombination protein RecR